MDFCQLHHTRGMHYMQLYSSRMCGNIFAHVVPDLPPFTPQRRMQLGDDSLIVSICCRHSTIVKIYKYILSNLVEGTPLHGETYLEVINSTLSRSGKIIIPSRYPGQWHRIFLKWERRAFTLFSHLAIL